MEWKTKITKLIGCKYPIILGAFGGKNNTKLTAAVSKAGGFGILTGSYFRNEDKFRKALLEIKNSTNNSFGINFSPAGPVNFQKSLSKMFDQYLEIAYEEKVNTIITAGPRYEEFSKKIKEYGINWIHKATTIKHAINGEKNGADAIILTGLEGGGYKNPKQNTLFINMVNANRILKIPIIASGGISNGKGMLMALISSAQAVHLCTAFLATEESPVANTWKQDIIDADCFDPELVNKVCHFDSDKPKLNPVSLAAGTINKVISAEQLIKDIIMEAESILKNLGFQGEIIDFTKL
ncbi:MAG: NAD(P)H-dependent flavin oxidoreductase [Candidatus Odinarchaeota archaeon]